MSPNPIGSKVEQLAQSLAEHIVPLIVDAINIDAILDKVDVEKIIERVDVDKILVEQTELGSIIARSTTGILTEVLDVVRAQGVGLDDFIFRWGNRLIGRRKKVGNWPSGPPLLMAPKAIAAP